MQYSLSAYARCDEGDEFYVSLTPGVTPDGRSFLKRTVVEMNDDLWDTYSARLERAGVRAWRYGEKILALLAQYNDLTVKTRYKK